MNNEIDEYTKGQNDMLALIKEIYYTSSKKEFEEFLGKDDLDAKEVAEHLGIKIQSVYCLASKVKHGARNPKIKIYRIEGKNDEY